jgi:hypothetical protein
MADVSHLSRLLTLSSACAYTRCGVLVAVQELPVLLLLPELRIREWLFDQN